MTPAFIEGPAEAWFNQWDKVTSAWIATIHLTVRQAREKEIPSGIPINQLQNAIKGKCDVLLALQVEPEMRSETTINEMARACYHNFREIHRMIPEPDITVRRRPQI